jgi:hypothetical protein
MAGAKENEVFRACFGSLPGKGTCPRTIDAKIRLLISAARPVSCGVCPTG